MSENQVSGKSRVIGATLLEKELAEVLGMPLSTVKRLRSEGKIPYVKVGRGRTIYLAESIIQWLKTKEVWESCGTTTNDTITGPEESPSVVYK
jgi:excisionase family DNA binding protein